MKQGPRLSVLDSGVRLVTERIPHAHSVSLGIWVDTGARHEEPGESGISHFTEHLLFKGTRRRTAKQIATSLESVGGYLDAFTGREHTCYYARILPEHLPKAFDVLADMLQASLFRYDHVRRERDVVLDEIKSFEDAPEELIHDLFASTVWRRHPLGKPVLGYARTVRTFNPSMVRRYVSRRYTADRVVVSAAGAVDRATIRRFVERRFRFGAGDGSSDAAGNGVGRAPMLKAVRRGLLQEHVCVGGEGLEVGSAERYALSVLTTILGGGASSRLFQRVREERGLAYSIYTYSDAYLDSGIVGTYAATIPTHTTRVIELILRECRRLIRDGISLEELRNAKSQVRGELIFSLESVSNRMRMIALPVLYACESQPVESALRRIERVTRDDVVSLAGRLLDPKRQTVVAIGPASTRRLQRALPHLSRNGKGRA